MRIIYINAMGAREHMPHCGIFVTRRIEALKKLNTAIVPISLCMEYSSLVKKLLLIKGIPDVGGPLGQQGAVRYRLVRCPFNLFEMMIAKIYPLYYGRKIFQQLNEQLSDLDGDLIHLHGIWPSGLAVARISQLYNIPYIVTCHGSEINVAMADKKINPAMINIMENATFVEFVSEALKNRAIELGYSGKNARVIYNGIDTDIFREQSILREKKKRVGFVGNLLPIKGADRIPDIFRKIYKEFGDMVDFVVIGQGGLLNRMREMTADLPVSYLGQITPKALSEEYNKMDVLVIPSRQEGFSCVIKEAQACGVIPVGNKIGGIPEAIGSYGIVISEQSEEALIDKLADAVVQILNRKECYDIAKMTKNAERFSWKEQQKQCLQLYEETICKMQEAL